MDASDYYIVTFDSREGVVDSNGKTVLPLEFGEIDVVSESNQDNDGNLVYFGKPLFFAVPVQAGPASARRRYSGFLYGATGKKVTSVRLSDAQAAGPDLIMIHTALPGDYVSYEADPSDYTPDSDTAGAILYSGKLVIPYQYEEIWQFGGTAAALKTIAARGVLDFYDLQGKLLRTIQVSGEYTGHYDQSGETPVCGNLLLLQDTDGKYGVLDEQLNWVLQPEWDNIQYDDVTGQFIVTKDNKVGVIDASGHIVIQPNSDESEYMTGCYYTFTDPSGISLLDDKGNVLLHSGSYSRLVFSNGVIIAQIAARGQAGSPESGCSYVYGLDGRFLLFIRDSIKSYLPEEGYFLNSDDTKIYDSNGIAFPLPDGQVQCLTADRFIVMQSAADGYQDNYGLCDAQGNWILRPDYIGLNYIGGNVLVYDKRLDDEDFMNPVTMDSDMFGLADLDGQILSEPEFLDFECYGGDLYTVETATMSGLMDSNLKWVWKTTVYDALTD